jgi:tetratricopeptide (TPR) repeat protein
MRRFPANEVAPNARAETLRDLGRYEKALAAFEDTMRRFPASAAAPTARAETLRDLGRYEEALAAFEETMRRFPHNEVTRNAYAHLLGQLGRIDDVEKLLAFAAKRSLTRGDWIAAHILAMAWLRVERRDQALAEFERGARFCVHRDICRYFETAGPLTLIASQRAAEAAEQLEALAKKPFLPPESVTNIVLFQAHALAEVGESWRAKTLVESAQIIDLATARQTRLAAALSERYGLSHTGPASGRREQQLNKDIATLEFELVRPKLWSPRTRLERAA